MRIYRHIEAVAGWFINAASIEMISFASPNTITYMFSSTIPYKCSGYSRLINLLFHFLFFTVVGHVYVYPIAWIPAKMLIIPVQIVMHLLVHMQLKIKVLVKKNYDYLLLLFFQSIISFNLNFPSVRDI